MNSKDVWTLILTPWYATMGVTALIFGSGMLLFLITLVAWLAAGVFRLLHHGHPNQRQPRGAFLGRVVAALFMLVFVVLVLSLVVEIADIDPAFGAPRLMLGTPPVFDILVKLAPVLGMLGVLTLPFVSLAWLKGYWSAPARLFYVLHPAGSLVLGQPVGCVLLESNVAAVEPGLHSMWPQA